MFSIAAAFEIGVARIRRDAAILATNRELASKLHQLERKVSAHDQSIAELIDAMRQLLAPPDLPKRPIGFVHPKEN